MGHVQVAMGCTAQDVANTQSASRRCLLEMLLSFQDIVQGMECIISNGLKVDGMQMDSTALRWECNKLLWQYSVPCQVLEEVISFWYNSAKPPNPEENTSLSSICFHLFSSQKWMLYRSKRQRVKGDWGEKDCDYTGNKRFDQVRKWIKIKGERRFHRSLKGNCCKFS